MRRIVCVGEVTFIYWTTGTLDVIAWRDTQMRRSVVCANDANRVVV
jgi:hypothetical protein